MCKLRFILTMLLLTVLVAVSGYGEAAPIINIAQTGVATYSIKAADLQESAGMDLFITYDANAHINPQVTSGNLTSSAIMVPNTATPGFIRIGIMTGGAIKGTGELVSITFTRVGTPVRQPQLDPRPSVYSASGSQLAVQSAPGILPLPTGNSSDADNTKNSAVTGSRATGAGSTASSAGVVSSTPSPSTTQIATTLGSVSLPQEPGAKNDLLRQDPRKEERSEEPVYQNDPAHHGAATGGGTPAPHETAAVVAEPEAKTIGTRSTLKSSQSVLDRFRAYKDIRTVKRLSILFDESVLHAAGIVQSPAIVVSDGKSLVTVAVDLAHETDTPSFSLKGANLKSIKRVSDKKWELAALPRKGKSDVRLSIIMKGEHTEIPLVVVPPVIQAAGRGLDALSVAALDALLAKPVKNSKPSYDLNSDGKQDYLDDYILVAHRLLKQQRSVNKAGQKPAAAGK